jgi:hypothetical protein
VWEGDYLAAVSTPTVITNGVAHDFGGGTNYITITKDSPSYFNLKWSDPAGASSNDYDLYLLNSTRNGNFDYSIDVQNGKTIHMNKFLVCLTMMWVVLL